MSYTSNIFRINNFNSIQYNDVKTILIDVINKWENVITHTPDNIIIEIDVNISYNLGPTTLGTATLTHFYHTINKQDYEYSTHDNPINPILHTFNLGDVIGHKGKVDIHAAYLNDLIKYKDDAKKVIYIIFYYMNLDIF